MIYLSLSAGDTIIHGYLTKLGIVFVSIEYGVLMTFEQLKRKVTFRSLFLNNREQMEVTSIGVFAHVLGKIGFTFIVIGFLISFIK